MHRSSRIFPFFLVVRFFFVFSFQLNSKKKKIKKNADLHVEGRKSIKPCHACQKERKKNVCRLLLFLFFLIVLFVCFFATSFISISFLKKTFHLHLLVLHLPFQDPFRGKKKKEGKKKRKTHRRQGQGQLDQDTYIIYFLPSLLLLEELVCLFLSFFNFLSPFLSSVCEDQVGKVRLQPVPGNHLAELWRAIVWEFKVRAQAALAERVQVLIHKRQGEVS